jgi:membrane protein YqaA with SNARE-associated domain
MIYPLTFVAVFFFNIIPAFTPPTWIILSYIALKHNPNPYLLALCGALAATGGRLVLATFAKTIVRNRLLGPKTIANLDVLKDQVHKRKKLAFSAFLLYAFGPLPSNQLFLAYGLTGLELFSVGTAFFIGRFASYLFWILTATTTAKVFAARAFVSGSFITKYFVIVQILTLFVVYVFTKIDWKKLTREKKISWLK